MSPLVTALVLGSALLHATWNALLRSTGDRLRGMLVINLGCALLAVPLVLVLPLPNAAAWPYILISAVFVTGYNGFLAYAYSHGELGQVYPVARGSSPLLVTLGAMIFAGERLTWQLSAGVALISLGIISLADIKLLAHRKAFVAAIVTGMFIAAYTVTDGMGGRLSGNVVAYTAWRSVICTVMVSAVYFRQYMKMRISLRDIETQKSLGAAFIALAGYTVIIWAMTFNHMGAVSALRETSVVFATLLGAVFLKEKLTSRRLAACAVIAAGAVLLQ